MAGCLLNSTGVGNTEADNTEAGNTEADNMVADNMVADNMVAAGSSTVVADTGTGSREAGTVDISACSDDDASERPYARYTAGI